jgi:hypothetical protein
MKLEKLSSQKFVEITNDQATKHLGGFHVEGSLFGWSWSGDATERCVGSQGSAVSIGVFSSESSGNCYQYDYNGMLNGHYVSSGWSSTSCVTIN